MTPKRLSLYKQYTQWNNLNVYEAQVTGKETGKKLIIQREKLSDSVREKTSSSKKGVIGLELFAFIAKHGILQHRQTHTRSCCCEDGAAAGFMAR